MTDLATHFRAQFHALTGNVDWQRPSLLAFVLSSVFNPLFWNVVARLEYRHGWMTRLWKSPKMGCYALAAIIFSLGIYRDHLFKEAIESQPVSPLLYAHPQLSQFAGLVLFLVGGLFVVSSMWRLGVVGTYLGDYFGILMEERVTAFPFNVMDDPMYNGSTMVFLGTAVGAMSGVGVILSAWVFLLYRIALVFEGDFTARIYADAAKSAKGKGKKSAPGTRSVSASPARKSARMKRE